ncbi:MAG: CusA/CzcA family heavy metal efflux RND transporter [bacterium]
MIEKIIEYCAKNRFVVFIFVSAAAFAGLWSMRNLPLDAIPDLSDTQVIIYSRWDRSPDIIEDQVTYPIVTALLGAPHVKDIRGFSDFGFSYVYIIFEDGTNIYWARSRTLEYLSKITPLLPEGVRTELGPDATGLGWVFQYALVDTTGQHNLADLRTFQDWYLKYYLQSIPGVAEVAPIGGFVRQYQIQINPNTLAGYKIPIMRVIEAIRDGNNDVGGRLIEFSGREYMVRGRGYAKSIKDIEKIVVGVNPQSGTPVLVRDIGRVVLGPEIRRGVSDLDGKGDAVGGIIVMRHGENALKVINKVKEKLREIEPSLPKGVKIVTTYDRSELIMRAIDTLKEELILQMIIVAGVILFFLWHFSSSLIPIFTLPVAVLISFIPMYFMRITSNIMSLGGIAIAIGAMVDASIILVENAHKRLEQWEEGGRVGDPKPMLIRAAQEVGRPIFFSLLVISISFMPIFTLEAQEGRLFKPLAFTKNFSMAFAAVLAITLAPALILIFLNPQRFRFRPRFLCAVANAVFRGKIHSEEKHPVSRILFRLYQPAVHFVLRFRYLIVALSAAAIISAVPIYMRLGSEFMPPLNEGTILYMPTTLPGMSVTEAQKLLQVQDKILRTFPEVERVFGKAGRAETSTDPAPFSMMETTVILKPESEWRKMKRWYSDLPEIIQIPFRHIIPDRLTWDELITEMDGKMRFPGVSNAWTMPIKARIDMLTTGVRTPVGIKVHGADLKEIEKIGQHVEMVLNEVPGTRSVYAERTAGGYFIDFTLKRDELARYGLSIAEVEMVIMSAIGGENITTTIEGRERYPVNVRYARDFRSSIDKLRRTLISTMDGAQIPLEQLADIQLVAGPAMIRNENGMLSGYVYVDVTGRDIGSYVTDAKEAVREKVTLPTGYSLTWSGQFEFMQRVRQRLAVVVPITVFFIFILIFFNTGSMVKTLIVFLAVPFSAIGAIWLLYLLGYNMSIGVWVGLIALMGIDAETGVIMLLYLDLAYDEAKAAGKMRGMKDLEEAIIHGAVKRIRPKMMTVGTTFMGLLPVMWSLGTGADVMKRVAAPMVGGIFTSFIMELFVYPAIYMIWKWGWEVKPSLKKK